MAEAQMVRLVGDTQRAYAKRLIDQAPADWVVRIGAPTRTLDQNAKLHAMLTELRQRLPELRPFTIDDLKLRFLNVLGTEMRFLPELEGQGSFPVGLRSSTLTVQQFSGLVELINAYAARHGVVFSDKMKDAA